MKNREHKSSCPLAGTLDLFGDRWTLLIIRDLRVGKQRFDEFISSSEGIATNILADRLGVLAAKGLITRNADPSDRRRFIYRLTKLGQSTGEFLEPMTRWGARQLNKARTNIPRGAQDG